MPDTFKILHESFSEPLPVTEDEGFHDFNALSRIAAAGEPISEPVPVPEPPRVTPAEPPSSYRHTSPQVAQPQPEAPAKPVWGKTQIEPPPATPAPQAQPVQREVVPPTEAVASAGSGTQANDAWRDLPLQNLLARLRTSVPVVNDTPKRLHGMFRR